MKFTSRLALLALAAIALLGAVAACGGGSAQAPVAVYRGVIGEDVLMRGTLVRDGPCLYVHTAGGDRTLIALPAAPGIRWDDATQTLYVGSGVNPPNVAVRVGEEVDAGGNGAGALGVFGVAWADAPDHSCDVSRVWLANSLQETAARLATATARPGPVRARARVTYSSIDRNWAGRDSFRVCVQDASGGLNSAARDRLTAEIESLASAGNPGLPVVVEAGCPFDYGDPFDYAKPPLIARTDPSVYSLQIYVRPDVTEPATEALEHWLPPGTDNAIPSTLGLTLPSSLVAGDPGALRAVLERYIGREPTHKPGAP